jgi:anaerobic ribonucleoside-triphosphate reductase activating protein
MFHNEILQMAAYLSHSTANGPGNRSVVWVQGCPLRCPGCFNPNFQPTDGGESVHVMTLIERLLAESFTEGVSFSGGEPFAQATAVAAIARNLQLAGKGVLLFTGFYYETLQMRADNGTRDLLAHTDLLVAGPYQRHLPYQHQLLSSSNQQLIFLTSRYRHIDFGKRRVEYRINAQGLMTVTGFPLHA